MGEYGYVITKDDISKQLKRFNRTYDGRRTWSELYGAVDTASQLAESNLYKDYSKQISEAYISANRQKSLIGSSALGSGFKESAYSNLEDSLRAAYESYRNTYESNVNTINQNAQTARNSITSELDKQSGNVKSYLDTTYDYLKYLYDLSKGDDNNAADEYLSNLFTNDGKWKQFTRNVTDNDGVVIDTELLSYAELLQSFRGNDGTLNEKGQAFYKQMLDSLSTIEGSKYSYGSYLSEHNSNLLDWAMSTGYDSNFVNNDAFVRNYLGIDNYSPSTDNPTDITIPGAPIVGESNVDSTYKVSEDFIRYHTNSGFHGDELGMLLSAKDDGKYTLEQLKSLGDKLNLDTSKWDDINIAYEEIQKYKKLWDESYKSRPNGENVIAFGRYGGGKGTGFKVMEHLKN